AGANRDRYGPPTSQEQSSRRSPLFACSSKAQRVRRAPPKGSGTVSRRTPFCACSLEAQRPRPAAPNRKGTLRFRGRRRGPFCASSSKAQRVRRAPPKGIRNSFVPHSVLRVFLRRLRDERLLSAAHDASAWILS